MPYERFARFHEVMAEESAQTVLSVLFSHILPLVPGMAERLEEGASLLDLGCGRGRALLHPRRALPGSTFLGYDLSAVTRSRTRRRTRRNAALRTCGSSGAT